MNDKMKAEFDAAFVKKFGFGRMMASANADAHQMLNAAEWAWEAAAAPTPPQPIYDEAKERELFEASIKSFPGGIWFSSHKGRYLAVNGRIYEHGQACDMNLRLEGWLACAQSRAKAGEDE